MADFECSEFSTIKEVSHGTDQGKVYLFIEGIQTQDMSFNKALFYIKILTFQNNLFNLIFIFQIGIKI